MSTLTDRLEFAITLAREAVSLYADQMRARAPREERINPSEHTIASLASDLMTAERRLHNLAEAYCNGFDHEPAYKANERATLRLQARVTARLAPYGITPRFGGDPRGVMITLTLPRTKRTNGWSGKGYCVPR